MKKKSRILVAVYGSLRQGHGNHQGYFAGQKMVGQFETDPIYTLVSLGSFPGLLKNGSVSVTMEVYEVDVATLARLDILEGYRDEDASTNFYNREVIKSPFGDVYTYFLNRPSKEKNLYEVVESGDWTDFFKTRHLIITSKNKNEQKI